MYIIFDVFVHKYINKEIYIYIMDITAFGTIQYIYISMALWHVLKCT